MNSLTWHPALPHWQMDQTTQGSVPFGPIDGSALIALVEYYGILMRYATIRQQRVHQALQFMVTAAWARQCSWRSSSAITCPPSTTERRIYGQLLMAMGASINERLTLMELEIRTVLLLKGNNVRVLVFDEVHNLLAGTPREQRVILQLLRYLSNEIKASLVCLGVSEARDAIAGDTQLARRLDQFVLPRWKADEEFQELVTAILRSLPLRLPSGLSSQSLRHLSRLGDGITARVFGILNELAIEGIKDGIERITDESIESWRPALEKEAAFA